MQSRELSIMKFISITVVDARRVMVAEGIAGPAHRGKRFQLSQTRLLITADMAGRDSLGPHEREVENQMQLILTISHIGNIVVLGNEYSISFIFIYHSTQFLHQFVHAGLCPLILEHIVPVLRDPLFLSARLSQFGSAA